MCAMFLLSLLSIITFASVALASSSVATSPVTNWDSSWTASSIQGTVVVIPCQTLSENATNNENALLVLLQNPSLSLPSFTVLDRAFVAWTGFAVDVECLTNQLLQYTDDHTSIYNQGPKNVATFLASCVRKESLYRSGRPYAVQALVVQRQRVWTIDPSGSCTLWNAGATALGRDAAAVRKQVHAALQAHTSTVPSVTQALRIAVQSLPKSASTRTNELPRAFLLREDREPEVGSASLSVRTLDPETVREQLRQLSLEGNSSNHQSNA